DCCAPPGEEFPRRRVRAVHQVARAAEVVATETPGVDPRQDNELDVGWRIVGLGQEAMVPGDGERLEEDVDGPPGQLSRPGEVPDVEDIDPMGAESDGTRDGDVVDDAAVDERLTVDEDGREDGRERRRG